MEQKNKKSFGQLVSNFSMPILLGLLVLAFSILSDKFFTPLNLTNILVQNVHIAICATGVFMIMVSGGCDLSIGYQMSVAAVLVAKLLSNGVMGVFPAIVLGVLICVALGCFNGVMSIVLNSQPMIVTLGTMAIFQGISFLISGSKTYHNLPRSFMFLGQGKIHGSWWDIAKVIGDDVKNATDEAGLQQALDNYYDKIASLFTMSDEEKNAWGVIGGICGTGWDTDFPMTAVEADVFESEPLELHAGEELKCRQGASWDVNYGVDGLNGANVVVEADGTYVVRLDVAAGTIVLIAQ